MASAAFWARLIVPGLRVLAGAALGAVSAVGLGGCGTRELWASEPLPEQGAAGAGLGGAQEPPPPPVAPTLRVAGRRLLDRCGEELLLRGANEMVAWSPGQDGEPEFAELAKTGANAVRIVWVSTASASALDGALRTARAAGLVPLVELHDGQGNFAMLPDLVAYWSAPETVSVVAEHERALLVEIGGGLGGAVPRDTWEAGYRGALATLRAAGLRVPLVIHAPNWGNDLERLIESGPGLLDADPGKNLLFAFSAWEASATTVSEALETMAQLQLPVIVAEFSGYLVGDCPLQPFDYAAFLETTARQRVGWFAWSWGGVSNADCGGALDMTLDGTLSGLQGWGLEVALGHPAGISRTSNQVASGCGAEDP